MMPIEVTPAQYADVQRVIADILKNYGVEGQSQGKLRYFAAKALLYTNHHQLEAKLKSDDRKPALANKERLTIDAFREMAATHLSRYLLDSLFVCDSCGTLSDKDSLPDAENLSMRLDDGGLHTSKECGVCGALSYPLSKMISGSVIDKLYHDKTLNITFPHADAFAKSLLSEYNNKSDADEFNLLLAKARLFYLDLLSQVYMMDQTRRSNLSLVIKDVNTFIAFANHAKDCDHLRVEMPDDDVDNDIETLDSLALLIMNDPAAPNNEEDTLQYIEDAKTVFFSAYC